MNEEHRLIDLDLLAKFLQNLRVDNAEQLNTAVSEATEGGKTVEKSSSYTLDNAVDYPLVDMRIYGKSMQDGVPTPDAPVDIVSVGDSGAVGVTACGKNLLNLNYFVDKNSLFKFSKIENGFSVEIRKDTIGTYGFLCAKLNCNLKNGATYIISSNNNAYEELKFQIRNKDGTNAGLPRKNKVVYDENYDLYVTCSMFGTGETEVPAGSTATFTNVQIELGDIATPYEPYIGSTANLTSALPLCGIPVSEGGNYTDSTGQQWIADELIYNADGTGKIVKRINKMTFDGSDDENWSLWSTITTIEDETHRFFIRVEGDLSPIVDPNRFNNSSKSICISDKYQVLKPVNTYEKKVGISCNHNIPSSPGFAIYDEEHSLCTLAEWKSYLASSPVTVVYALNTPQETQLTADEMAQLEALQTFNGTTNISNDGGAEMQIKYCTNSALSEYVKPIKTGLQKQIDELKTAVLSLGGNV